MIFYRGEGMGFSIIIIFALIAVPLYFLQKSNHEKKIYEQVEGIGGKVVSFERRTLRTGPFILPGKGRTVYRIEYELGGQLREGWVKFGGMFGGDWRL